MKALTKISKLSAFLTFFIFTCSCKDEEIKIICLPLSLTSNGQDIRYEYDDQGMLISVSYYSQGGSFASRKIIPSYNSDKISGGIDKVINPDGIEILLNKYDIEYIGDKPSKLLTGLNPDSREITTFSYDTKGRLELRTRAFGSMVTKTRYEYNDQDNVIKIFYTSAIATTEVLGAEIISFDNKTRFYSGSKALEILNVFAFDYEPSKNNKLQSNVSWDNPSIQNIPPRTETYLLGYNDDGLITSISTTPFTSGFTFFGLKYTCD